VGLIERFNPPAFLPDFDRVPGLADEWSQALCDWFDSAIDDQCYGAFRQHGVHGAKAQFFNPLKYRPQGKILEQPVVWNAFPKTMLRQCSYDFKCAMRGADKTFPLSGWISDPSHRGLSYRPGSEYCEWRVTRDPASKKIQKITFTSEPPEYWRALFGGSIQYSQFRASVFHGDPKVVLSLYHELVSHKVKLDDLRAKKKIAGNGSFPDIQQGEYNPFNKWNTTDGIVHLTEPSNSILAEISLAAAATILRKDSRDRLLVQPEELICCAGYGNQNANSDPTIGATVNALARLGARVTFKDPVGVYMDHIDLAGWTAPKDEEVSNFVRFTRGEQGMFTRLEIEVPHGKFQVGDLRIGGVPISHGGQVAECITVKLVGVAAELQSLHNPPLSCASRCFVTKNRPLFVLRGKKVPAGRRMVFVHEGEQEQLSAGGLREAQYHKSLHQPTRAAGR
jgi:hypothetical protein